MTASGGSGGTTTVRSPRVFNLMLVLVGIVLLASTVVLVVAFFMSGPLEQHQEGLLTTFEDGFKTSLAAFLGLLAGKALP